jgi:hypothetical protein
MSATVVAIPLTEADERISHTEARVQIVVNIRATVMELEAARHKANAWLHEQAIGKVEGGELSATKPELVVDEELYWRFEVILGLPNEAQPGSGALYRVGQILLDAASGDIQGGDSLAEELRESVEAIAS